MAQSFLANQLTLAYAKQSFEPICSKIPLHISSARRILDSLDNLPALGAP